MDHIISPATGNFIKVIYKFEQVEGGTTKSGAIAGELGITNAAATDMARKLAARNLVNYIRYKPLSLTPEGQKLALNIIRKHRLWESFLYQILHLSLHEIHREAEVLEHLTSDFLADKIDQFLGKPELDPHGDPIPDERGIIHWDKKSVLLSCAAAGKEYEISRLSSSDKEFFDFCHSNHLTVGSTLTVKKQYEKKRMTDIEINRARLLLNAELTGTIHVKEITND
jgi:DtxR family Mn-dependent transcriptional regulator